MGKMFGDALRTAHVMQIGKGMSGQPAD